MNKTVGLVVVTYKDNFGSALQSYATQTIVRKLGFDTEILQIDGVHDEIQKRKIKFYLKRLFVKDEFLYIFDKINSKINTKKGQQYSKNMLIRHMAYEQFNKEYFIFAPRQETWKDLTKQCMKYEKVLVGSDQLWRPSNIAGGYFTLEFVPKEIPRISYSTSFGVSSIPKFQQKSAKKFLSEMTHISVRENTGKNLIYDLVGLNVPVVCDPTMLLTPEDWIEFESSDQIVKDNYILCYFMGNNAIHRSFVKRLKEFTGYKIVGLLHGSTYIASDDNFPDETPFNIGPREFINLIRNAKYFCTDSFHGTVFSILNKTPFFSFRRYKDKSEFSTNDRLYTLLSWTGLSERMLSGNEDILSCLNMKIDFDSVLATVNENRLVSLSYLKKALLDE